MVSLPESLSPHLRRHDPATRAGAERTHDPMPLLERGYELSGPKTRSKSPRSRKHRRASRRTGPSRGISGASGDRHLDQLIEQMRIAAKRREWRSLRQLDNRQSPSGDWIRRTRPMASKYTVYAADTTLEDAVCGHAQIGGLAEHRAARADHEIDAFQERHERNCLPEHNRFIPPRHSQKLVRLPAMARREDDDSVPLLGQMLECAESEPPRVGVVVMASLGRRSEEHTDKLVVLDFGKQ